LNILVLSELFWPEGSGGELATYIFSKMLSKYGFNVNVITLSRNADFLIKKVGNMYIYSIPCRILNKYVSSIKSLILITQFRKLFKVCDVIYMNGWETAIPVIRLKFKKPIVLHLHSYFPACPIGSLYNLKWKRNCLSPSYWDCIECISLYSNIINKRLSENILSAFFNSALSKHFRNFLEFVDKIVFVSHAQKNIFLRHLPQLASISHVIHNPLPDLSFISIKKVNLGYFGGVSILKGFEILLKAWVKVINKHHNNTWLHITKAEHIYESYRSNLKNLRIFPHRKLNYRQYEALYKIIGVVTIPSIWFEPWGYVASEACLRGRPLIVSKIGGIYEQVNGFRGIRFIHPGDIEEFADAIDEFISMDINQIEELGLKNREDILTRFDNLRILTKLIRVFEEVL